MSNFIQSIDVFEVQIPTSKTQVKKDHSTYSNILKNNHKKAFSFSLDKHFKHQKSTKQQKKAVYINSNVEKEILKEIEPFKEKIKKISLNFKMDQKICFQFVNKMLTQLGVQCELQKKQKSNSSFFPGSYKRIQRLQQLLIEKQFQISLLQQKLDVYKNEFDSHQKQPSEIFSNLKLLQATDLKVNLNPSQSLQQNLYHQARVLKLSEFTQLCQQVLLKHKPSITNIYSLKNQQLQKTNLFLKQIHDKVFLISQNLLHSNTPNTVNLSKTIVGKTNKTVSEQIEEISALLKDLNKLHNINSLIFTCRQPCCLMKDVSDQRINKAKLVLELKQNPKKNNYYKTDSSQQYFKRYYKGVNFNETKIFSVQKTKTQEMQHLEILYKKRKSRTRNFSNLNQKQSRSTFNI